jgi:hypothetical protein
VIIHTGQDHAHALFHQEEVIIMDESHAIIAQEESTMNQATIRNPVGYMNSGYLFKVAHCFLFSCCRTTSFL